MRPGWTQKPVVLLHLDLLAVGLPQRKLIAAKVDFNRVTQRCDLSDKDHSPFGQPHIHDSALDRSFSVQLDNGYGLARFDILE